jgi:hypothetical protein
MSIRRVVISGILALIAGVVAVVLMPKPLPELSRQELLEEVRSGYVHEVTIVDGEVAKAISSRYGQFRVTIPKDDTSLIAQLSAMGVKVNIEKTPLGTI